jgi:hypothetical protein
MGVAALFAFIEAVGKVISTVKSIVDFAKHAEDFFNGVDDWESSRMPATHSPPGSTALRTSSARFSISRA